MEHHSHTHDEHCGCGQDHHGLERMPRKPQHLHDHHHHPHESCGCSPALGTAVEEAPKTALPQKIYILENLGCANCAA